MEEALHSDDAIRFGIDNTPSTQQHLDNIIHTAHKMEDVRRILGAAPILISSWYRNRETNTRVGGVKNSAHAVGLAVDFTAPAFGDVLACCVALRDSDLRFDQLIYEYGRWVHIGFCNCPKPRRQVLTKLTGRPYAYGLPGA